MKKISIILALLIVCTCIFTVPTNAENSISASTKIVIDEGSQIKTEGYPPVQDSNGNILVPARRIMSALGGSVYYNKERGSIAIIYYDSYIGLSTNNNSTTIERIINSEQNESINLESGYIANSMVIGDEIYVPLDALGHALGLEKGVGYGYNSVEDEVYLLNVSYNHAAVPVVCVSDLNSGQFPTNKLFKIFGTIVKDSEGNYCLQETKEENGIQNVFTIPFMDIPQVENYWKDQLGVEDPNGTEVVITSFMLTDEQGRNAISLLRAYSSILPLNSKSKVLEERYKVIVDNKQLIINDSDQFSRMFDKVNPDSKLVPYTLYVPFRELLEQGFDAHVEWFDTEKIVKVSYNYTTYLFTINSPMYKKAGSDYSLGDFCPVIINDRTFLPAAAISEAMGYEVDWDEINKTVKITDPNPIVEHDVCVKIEPNSLDSLAGKISIKNNADNKVIKVDKENNQKNILKVKNQSTLEIVNESEKEIKITNVYGPASVIKGSNLKVKVSNMAPSSTTIKIVISVDSKSEATSDPKTAPSTQEPDASAVPEGTVAPETSATQQTNEK